MVYHTFIEGNIIKKDTDDEQDQQNYWDQKIQNQKNLLAKMNKELAQDTTKPPNLNDPDTKKSLRN